MSIRSVIFDIDNTLYDYDAAHAIAWKALLRYAEGELALTEEAFTSLHSQASAIVKAHAFAEPVIHNRLIRYQLMLETAHLPLRHAPKLAELYWRSFLEAMRPMDGLDHCFDELRRMGLILGIGTNMNADLQFLKLERLGLLPLLSFVVTSEEVGVEKPDHRLFDRCVGKSGCAREECLFVGDSLKGDVLGALNAGIPAAWLRPTGAEGEVPKGAAVLDNLSELPEQIRSLSQKEPTMS